MIAVDTSAIIALRLGECEAERFAEVIGQTLPIIPASCVVEAAITLRRRLGDTEWIGGFIREANARIAPIEAGTVRLALDAPLLFKGDDSRHTDVTPAA